MKITFDERKRQRALLERKVDFEDAASVFAGPTLTAKDQRVDYGEDRFQTVGFLDGRMVMVVWTPRGGARHVISMRNAMTMRRRATRTDLKAFDAHTPRKAEYDDAPELTDAQLNSAVLKIGGRPVGRPKLERPKRAVNLRLDADVIDAFRAGGSGWQTRMNEALRKAAGLKRSRR
jgi:hypothetical protein